MWILCVLPTTVLLSGINDGTHFTQFGMYFTYTARWEFLKGDILCILFILATARIGLHALVLKKHIRSLILSSAAVLYFTFVLAPVSLSLISLL